MSMLRLFVIIGHFTSVRGNDGRRDSALPEVAEGVEAIPGPGQSDTHPVVRPQKAHGPLLVAPDQGQDDDVILLSLVVVHGRHAHTCNSEQPMHDNSDQPNAWQG